MEESGAAAEGLGISNVSTTSELSALTSVPDELLAEHPDVALLQSKDADSEDEIRLDEREGSDFLQADERVMSEANQAKSAALPSLSWTSTQNDGTRSTTKEPQGSTPILPTYHRQLQPEDLTDLVNTIQTIWEDDSEVRENGVILLDVPSLAITSDEIHLPSSEYNFEATSQRVSTSKAKPHKFVVIKHETATLRMQRPSFPCRKDLTSEEMEEVFRHHVNEHSNTTRHPYFNIDISDRRVRPPGSFELTCGSPMDKLSYIAGMNTPYGYFSQSVSHFGAHVEDWHCASYNILFAGATKLWIAVKPSSLELFERKVRELIPGAGDCVQFIRHQALNIAPSTLREWGVDHFFVPQNPGQLVAVSGFTYHWGINTGRNYAEAINFCVERDWQASDSFKMCYPGCGINLESLPLPKPFYQEGTMEEKKAKSFERDQAAQEQWAKEVEAYLLEQERTQTPRKSSQKKPKPSDTTRKPSVGALRTQDSSSRQKNNQNAGRREDSGDHKRLPGAVDVATLTRRLGEERQPKRRVASQRAHYQDFGSQSEAGSTDEDEVAVQPLRPPRSMHSRHNSSHHPCSDTQDVSALSGEVKGIKNQVLGFLMAQKQAAAKQEELMRMQLEYQKRQYDNEKRWIEMQQRQVDIQQRQMELQYKQMETEREALETVRRMDHRLMMMLQTMESQRLSKTPDLPPSGRADISSPSVASTQARPSQEQLQFSAMAHANRPAHLHSEQASCVAVEQRPFRRDLPHGPLMRSNLRTEIVSHTSVQDLVNAASKPRQSTIGSAQTSRRPSTVALSERASEIGFQSSPDYSPLLPHMKTMHSTPRETETSSSAPSSLSEQNFTEGVILVQAQVGKKTQNDIPESNPSVSNPSTDSEYVEQPSRSSRKVSANGMPKGSMDAMFTAGPWRCLRCREKRDRTMECDKNPSGCSRCLKEGISCVYPEKRNGSRKSIALAQKRQAINDITVTASAPSAKKHKTSEPSPTGSPSARSTPGPMEQSSSRPRASVACRELVGLAATSEYFGSQPPTSSKRSRGKSIGA